MKVKQALDFPSDMVEVAGTRANFYSFLSRIYIGPLDQKSLATMLDRSQTSLLTDRLPEQIQMGIKVVNDFLVRSNVESSQELQRAISIEFTRLFRALNRQYSPPPPYESVYLSESGHVFDESTIAILNEYRRFGLRLPEQYRGEPPDHVSFELDFMRFLCTAEAEAWKASDVSKASTLLKAEKQFLEAHLLTWVPKLCNQIKMDSQIDLFRGFADLTEGWIRFDHDLIQECLTVPHPSLPEIKTS